MPLPPPSAPITWDANTSLVPIYPKDDSVGDRGESSTSTRDDIEPENPPITWHDIALSIATEMMQRARDHVRTELGYSTSAVCIALPRSPLALIRTYYSS